VIKRTPWGHSTTRSDLIYHATAGAVCGGPGRANARHNGLSGAARDPAEAEQAEQNGN